MSDVGCLVNVRMDVEVIVDFDSGGPSQGQKFQPIPPWVVPFWVSVISMEICMSMARP